MILLAYGTALNSHGIADLLTERLTDMLLGCAMALVGTAAAFPRRAVSDLDVAEDSPSGHTNEGTERGEPGSSHKHLWMPTYGRRSKHNVMLISTRQRAEPRKVSGTKMFWKTKEFVPTC
jgi:hypothetical protein